MKKKKLIHSIYTSQFGVKHFFYGPFGKRYLTYSDYIASGQPLKLIEDFINKQVLTTYANTHTEASFTGKQTGLLREEARQTIKNSVKAGNDDVLLFTGSGSTGAIDLLNRKLEQFYSEKEIKPVVFIGPYEHHSNILPWREGSFELIEIPITDEGTIDLEVLEKELKTRQGITPMIGSFSAASNVTGIISPVRKVTDLLKKYGALSFWDFAGGAPYMDINMNPDGHAAIDAIFISAHKLIGGPGSPGILVAKKSLFEKGLPVVVGGGTVHFVTKTSQSYNEDIEIKEEGGTPAIIESIRAGLVFKLKDLVGAKNIESIEESYIKRAISALTKTPEIFILGSLTAKRLSFLAFHIRYKDRFLHHNFVVALLNDLFGIQSRGGCSCAGPYGHELLQISDEKSCEFLVELNTGNVGIKPGWVRLNFNYFIPEDEFLFILDAIKWIAKNGYKLLSLYHFDDTTALWAIKNSSPKGALASLNQFLDHGKIKLEGSLWRKKRDRKSYFHFANKLAEKEFSSFQNRELQTYVFPQVNNGLRWYALAQDIDLK